VRAHGLKWGVILLLSAPGRGIIRRAIEDIFAAIEHDAAPHSKFLVRASYLQIYNEVGGHLPLTPGPLQLHRGSAAARPVLCAAHQHLQTGTLAAGLQLYSVMRC
jgi:hypothetical protein